jgi:hypothetical protein
MLVTVHNHKVQLAGEAGYELVRFLIAVDSAKHMPLGNRNVVLHEVNLDAALLVDPRIVELKIFPAAIAENFCLSL